MFPSPAQARTYSNGGHIHNVNHVLAKSLSYFRNYHCQTSIINLLLCSVHFKHLLLKPLLSGNLPQAVSTASPTTHLRESTSNHNVPDGLNIYILINNYKINYIYKQTIFISFLWWQFSTVFFILKELPQGCLGASVR